MIKSCIAGLSENKIDELRSRIPSKIETQMSVMQEEEHPQYNYYQEQGGSCDNSIDDNHVPCQRKKDHKGKHYCYDCGESWN